LEHHMQNLDFVHIGRSRTLSAVDNVKPDTGAFFQGFETLGDDSGMMDKHIFSAVFLNKAKPLGIIEPFHSAF